MSLVPMKMLLRGAVSGGYGVGAYSVGNMEMVMGAVRAMEEAASPGILQIAEGRLGSSPLELIAPVMTVAAGRASVPVAVHFDHGATPEVIERALELGFTSVMYDGSHLPLEENIKNTLRVKAMADRFGASLEGEIGRIGRTEDGRESEAVCSDPEEAARFYRETGVDALAVAIGNAHGNYEGEPRLAFDVLERLAAALPGVPLVLHGGTGIGAEDFRRCIRCGVRKINIATASFDAVAERAIACCQGPDPDYFSISRAMEQGTYDSVSRHIAVFGGNGKAFAE